ncbi:MAG: hypothetical protein ABIN01_06135 [Ferruginibacter sp.]
MNKLFNLKKTFMKTISQKTTKSIFSAAIIFFLVFLLASCSKKISFQTSTVVPAAQGSVKVKKDKNNNYSIDLNVIRLAEPKRLDPPKNTYVVWMETADNGLKNIGSLNTSSSMFSKTLKSSLETVSAFKPVSVFITAEDNSNIQYPGYQVVLRTNRF